VAADRIEVGGVPTIAFGGLRGVSARRGQARSGSGAATLLLMGGGFGWGPMEGMLEIVLGLPDRVQAIVVGGRNPRLCERLSEMARGREDRIRIHGFSDRVNLLLEASDLLVGKAGGLTSSEAMARGVPMVVFRPIPGQEERNCDPAGVGGGGAGSTIWTSSISGSGTSSPTRSTWRGCAPRRCGSEDLARPTRWPSRSCVD
jgi:processive 1,2-diacylglycerol beta-glucosyltransferase